MISFAILEQSLVIISFVFAGQAGRVRYIVININSAPTQMIDGSEKPNRSLQTCSAIQRIWLQDTVSVYVHAPREGRGGGDIESLSNNVGNCYENVP